MGQCLSDIYILKENAPNNNVANLHINEYTGLCIYVENDPMYLYLSNNIYYVIDSLGNIINFDLTHYNYILHLIVTNVLENKIIKAYSFDAISNNTESNYGQYGTRRGKFTGIVILEDNIQKPIYVGPRGGLFYLNTDNQTYEIGEKKYDLNKFCKDIGRFDLVRNYGNNVI